MRKSATALLICVALTGAAACGTELGSPAGLDPLVLTTWGPPTVLAGTPFVLGGAGFVKPQLGSMTLSLDGSCGTKTVDFTAQLTYVDDHSAVWNVSPDFVADIVAYDTPFVGTMEVTRKVFGYPGSDSAELSVTLHVEHNVQPEFMGFEQEAVWIGDTVSVNGQGLLTYQEGQTMLFLSGVYLVKSPPMEKAVQGVAIPLEVENRNLGKFMLTPDKFGVYPGQFKGTAWLENYAPASMEKLYSPEVADVELSVLPAVIESFAPDVVRRGQTVQVTGRGFIPTEPVGETATLVLLEGMFAASSGKEISFMGKDALLMFPEVFLHNTYMEVVLRVNIDVDGNLTGLGLIPGVFNGMAYPQLFFGGQTFLGQGLEFSVTVAPQLQVVFIKYLPSFDEAFHSFGLYEVRHLVKEKIRERCMRDYSAFNVTFVDERPQDYVEYSIIELSGEDPNGANLLGLDNTTGKDINNLRFNDIVGGKNAETEEQGFYAYGGVFLKSFLLFSPTISAGSTALASPRFDDVFGFFVPQLSGAPVEPGEYPGGARQAQIEEAARVLGYLLGGTVAHEIGHSLGLSMVPGHPDEYHNMGDNPAWLMDAGNFRPFVERTELDGNGPEVFAPYNFDYLAEILPKG